MVKPELAVDELYVESVIHGADGAASVIIGWKVKIDRSPNVK